MKGGMAYRNHSWDYFDFTWSSWNQIRNHSSFDGLNRGYDRPRYQEQRRLGGSPSSFFFRMENTGHNGAQKLFLRRDSYEERNEGED